MPTATPKLELDRYEPPAQLVFLCGVASGGTDLLQNVVNGHPAIFMPGEFPFLAAAAETYGSSVPDDMLPRLVSDLRHLDEYNSFVHHHYSNWIANRRDPVELPSPPRPRSDGRLELSDVFQWLVGVPPTASWSGNKTPTNTENMDKLHQLFPEARFIVIVRDPRDVALSWRRKWGKDSKLAAAKWERRLARGRDLAVAMPDDRVLFIRFEDLLDDLEATCRSICEFLDLDYTPDMLRFYEQTRKQIAGKPNWGKPIVPGNHGKWREALTPRMVRRLEELAFRGMEAHGYKIEYARQPRGLTRLEQIVGMARDLYALIFVGNRHHDTDRLQRRLRQIGLEIRKMFLRRSIRY